jgi:hypothetical protein
VILAARFWSLSQTLGLIMYLSASISAKESLPKPIPDAKSKVNSVYSWIFQFGKPIAWRETIAGRRLDLTDQLYNLLREESAATEPIDFDPFLDQVSDATGFSILPTTEKDQVKVEVHGLTSRVITVHCVYLLDWRIDNLDYQWSTPQDICSLLLAKRKPQFTF